MAILVYYTVRISGHPKNRFLYQAIHSPLSSGTKNSSRQSNRGLRDSSYNITNKRDGPLF